MLHHQSISYRPEIDGLRAIAVAAVLAFHAFPNSLPGGFIGVDIFFVISGYLITSIIVRESDAGHFSFLAFYQRRVLRILPSLLSILVVTISIGCLILIPEELEILGKHLIAAASFSSNLVYWKESGYFDTSADTKPLLHLWSLAIEEQFYIFWPLLIIAFKNKPRKLLFAIVATTLISFFLNIGRSEQSAAFYLPQCRFWELGVGGIIALIGKNHRDQKRVAQLITLIGLLLIGLGLTLISSQSFFPGFWALLPVFGSALLILGIQPGFWAHKVLCLNPLIHIGKISYPLYLWHWPIFSLAFISFGEHLSIGQKVILLIATYVLSLATYRYIEIPIRNSHESRAKTSRNLLLLLLAVGLSGALLLKTKGLPERFGKRLIESEESKFNCSGLEKGGVCFFGNPSGDQTIVIYGDSHASQLGKAVHNFFGNQYKIGLVSEGNCFLGNSYSPPHQASPKALCESKAKIVKTLQGEKIIATIYAQWWQGYGILSDSEIKLALKDAEIALGLQPRHLFVLSAIPNYDVNCHRLAYYAPRGRRLHDCKKYDESTDQKIAFESAANLIEFNRPVTLINTLEILCHKNKSCSTPENTLPYYQDWNHLNAKGAMLLMPVIEQQLATTAAQILSIKKESSP